MRIITLPGNKREIGKTTTTVNRGAALVEMGRRVLLLNTDPQTSCSRSVGVAVSDPIRSLCATPLGHISLTETEPTVRSPLDRLGAGSFVRIRVDPAAYQCHHHSRRDARPLGPRSPP